MQARAAVGVALGLFLLVSDARAQGRAGADTEEGQTFEAAEAAFAAKNYDEAAKLYEKVNSINPQHSGAYVKRGVIFYIRKQYSLAVGLLRKAQQLLPDDLDIKAQLGLSLYKSGATDMAVEIMEEVTTKKPDAIQVQIQLGQHYNSIGEGKKAAVAFDNYFKHRPDEIAASDVQWRPQLGNAYLIAGQYPDAQRQFEQTLKADPNSLAAKVGLGAVYVATKQCSRAITLYQGLLPVAAQQPSIYYNMSKCYVELHRLVEAEKYIDMYVKARPKELKGFLLLGTIRRELRNFGGAIEALQQGRALDAADTKILVELGRVYNDQKNFKDGIAVLESAQQLKPEDIEIITQLVFAYVAAYQALGSVDKKLVPTLIVLAAKLVTSSSDEALLAAALCYYIAVDDANAEKYFTAAITANPRNIRARGGLLLTHNRVAAKLKDAGSYAEAETHLAAAMKIDPTSVQTLRNLGLVQLLAKKYAEAEKTLQAALARVPTDLVVNRLLARVYLAQKKNDEALKAYQVAEGVALRSRGNILAEVYVEMGPVYADSGKLDLAVSSLENAQREAATAPVREASLRNLAIALYKRGLERMKNREAETAYDDFARAGTTPTSALTAKELAAMNCAAGVAALKAAKPKEAQDAFAKVGKEGCVFNAPFDKVGLQFFTAFAQYRETTPAKRDAAANLFKKLVSGATGSFRDLLTELIRSSYEQEGYQYWNSGEVKKSSTALGNAKHSGGKSSRILDHNLAVIELHEGKFQSAEKAFEALGGKPPEALLNLGIIKDHDGDSLKALELYKSARDKGSKGGALREWISSKEKLLNK